MKSQTATMKSDREMANDLHWPKCWECGNEDTTLHPASNTYTCPNCGMKWEANGDIVEEPR